MEGRPPRIEGRRDMGSLSESSTPRVAFTPQDSEAPSLPANVSDMSKSLARIFGVYAKGIVNTTQSISQNKAAKTRLRRSRKADEKWQGRYGDFAALEEMQSKTLVSSEKKSSKCEKALDAVKKSHKHATTQIASILAQSAHSTPPSRSSELQGAKVTTEVEGSSLTTERIKAEMTRLRGEFEKLQTLAQRAELVVGKQKRLESEFDELSTRLDDELDERTRLGNRTNRLEGEMHEVSAGIRDKVSFSVFRAYEQDSAKLKLLVSKAEAIITRPEKPEERVEAINENFDTAAFANRIDGLQAKIELLETTRLDDRVQALESKNETLESKEYDVATARDANEAVEKDLKDQKATLQALKTFSEISDRQFTELKEDLSQQTSEIRKIRDDVFGGGDSNEASLLEMIEDSQTDASKFRNMFNIFNTTMDEHQASIDNLKARLKGFKDSSAANEMEGALADIDELKQDIARLYKEQELKDDIVSKEVMRINDKVILQDNILLELGQTVKQVDRMITPQEDEPLSKSQSAPQMNERLDEIGKRLAKQDDSSLKNREDIKALKFQLQELSSKATDSQHPSDEILTQHRGLITDLIAKVDDLWSPAHASHRGTQSPHLTNGIVGTKAVDVHKIEALENGHQAIKQEFDGLQSKFELFKESTTDTTSNHETFIDSLRQRFDNLTTDHMIRHMIYHLQQIWPNHPGNVLNQITNLHQRLIRTERDCMKSLTQLQHLESQTEAQRHQIVLRGTEQNNLLEQVRKDLQQRIAEQQTLSQRANEESLRRDTEQLSLIEQAKEHSQRRAAENFNLLKTAKEDFHRQHTELSRLLAESKQDFQQQNKVLSEETQEKHTIIEQDVKNHLGRIQALQKGLQSLRTDHTTSTTDLCKTLKDVQAIIQNLGSTQTNGTTNAFDLGLIKSSLETTQQRINDIEKTFINDMAETHSDFVEVRRNLEELNKRYGVTRNVHPATSEPSTAVTSPFRNTNTNPNESNIINLEDEEDFSSSRKSKTPFDPLDSLPAQPLAVRGGSVSLGVPSSPPEPVHASRDRTPKPEEGSSDSEPIVRSLKRRRGRPNKESVENSPRGRGRKSGRIS